MQNVLRGKESFITKKYKNMKLSKSLLQSVVVGLAIGTAVSSCSFVEDHAEVKPEVVQENNGNPGGPWGGGTCFDCPACGLG